MSPPVPLVVDTCVQKERQSPIHFSMPLPGRAIIINSIFYILQHLSIFPFRLMIILHVAVKKCGMGGKVLRDTRLTPMKRMLNRMQLCSNVYYTWRHHIGGYICPIFDPFAVLLTFSYRGTTRPHIYNQQMRQIATTNTDVLYTYIIPQTKTLDSQSIYFV